MIEKLNYCIKGIYINFKSKLLTVMLLLFRKDNNVVYFNLSTIFLILRVKKWGDNWWPYFLTQFEN